MKVTGAMSDDFICRIAPDALDLEFTNCNLSESSVNNYFKQQIPLISLN